MRPHHLSPPLISSLTPLDPSPAPSPRRAPARRLHLVGRLRSTGQRLPRRAPQEVPDPPRSRGLHRWRGRPLLRRQCLDWTGCHLKTAKQALVRCGGGDRARRQAAEAGQRGGRQRQCGGRRRRRPRLWSWVVVSKEGLLRRELEGQWQEGRCCGDRCLLGPRGWRQVRSVPLRLLCLTFRADPLSPSGTCRSGYRASCRPTTAPRCMQVAPALDRSRLELTRLTLAALVHSSRLSTHAGRRAHPRVGPASRTAVDDLQRFGVHHRR